MRIPTPTEINDTRPQHVLEGLNSPLALAVCLRVECCAEVKPRAQLLVKLFPEAGGKPDILIRYNGNGNPMARHDHPNIQFDQFLGL